MAVGESVGCENIVSASRMNKAVVVFVKDRELVHQLIEDGIRAAQRLLYGEGIAWADMAYALLRRVEDLNYDKHLFVLNLREMDLSATTLFYQSVLRAWSSVLRISRINAQPFQCTEEEPLFHNPLIRSRMISSPYIQQRFWRAGITRVKDLRSGNS
ncbi:hypothetical protein QTP86_009664 [Hemibagrus guttatus]|nr:hypothetical protein QTP86_009664 [Hemibagrus guttatus]